MKSRPRFPDAPRSKRLFFRQTPPSVSRLSRFPPFPFSAERSASAFPSPRRFAVKLDATANFGAPFGVSSVRNIDVFAKKGKKRLQIAFDSVIMKRRKVASFFRPLVFTVAVVAFPRSPPFSLLY